MSILFDQETGKFFYKGKEVGEHRFENGKSTVTLNISYETSGEWMVPLSWFAAALAQLPENRPPVADLSVETPADSTVPEAGARRALNEKTIKGGGYIWVFHKSDVDPWPSLLHGHEYEMGLKLDVTNGQIFDVSTRQFCETLKSSYLKHVQRTLRKSKDFRDKVMELIGDEPAE
jgi:hypothetical protein